VANAVADLLPELWRILHSTAFDKGKVELSAAQERVCKLAARTRQEMTRIPPVSTGCHKRKEQHNAQTQVCPGPAPAKNAADGRLPETTNKREEIGMKILFINNDGGGFADYLEIAEGTTVQDFFHERLPGREADAFLIRVNRQPVAQDCVLQDGDRVTITPTKIEGGHAPDLQIK